MNRTPRTVEDDERFARQKSEQEAIRRVKDALKAESESGEPLEPSAEDYCWSKPMDIQTHESEQPQTNLLDRINRVINQPAFDRSLEDSGLDLFEFQATWMDLSGGDFDKLPADYRAAILAGEKEIDRDSRQP